MIFKRNLVRTCRSLLPASTLGTRSILRINHIKCWLEWWRLPAPFITIHQCPFSWRSGSIPQYIEGRCGAVRFGPVAGNSTFHLWCTMYFPNFQPRNPDALVSITTSCMMFFFGRPFVSEVLRSKRWWRAGRCNGSLPSWYFSSRDGPRSRGIAFFLWKQANGNLQSESPNWAASMLRCWQWRDACEHVDISASGLGILCRHVNMPFWMFWSISITRLSWSPLSGILTHVASSDQSIWKVSPQHCHVHTVPTVRGSRTACLGWLWLTQRRFQHSGHYQDPHSRIKSIQKLNHDTDTSTVKLDVLRELFLTGMPMIVPNICIPIAVRIQNLQLYISKRSNLACSSNFQVRRHQMDT